MNTYTSITYQVTFATKYRKKCLLKKNRDQLHAYMAGVINNMGCRSFRVGGVEDHLHLVFSLHPTVALAELVKDVKLGSSAFIKQEMLFPEFQKWQIGYGAFTYAAEALPNLVHYVVHQEVHHRHKTFKEELIEMYRAEGIDFDDRYLD